MNAGNSSDRAVLREPEAAVRDRESPSSEPAWKAEKAALDALDDGNGPYMHWAFVSIAEQVRKRRQWRAFKAWAHHHLGQGFSLACLEGSLVDGTTSWAFTGYMAGMDAAPLQTASGCSHTDGPDEQSKVDDQEPTAGSSHG